MTLRCAGSVGDATIVILMTVAARLVGDDFSISLGALAFNGLPV